MKKFLVMFVAALMVFTVAACEREEEEPSVVFDEDAGRFEIEEDADEIVVGVDSDPMREALEAQWAEDYPEYEDLLVVEDYESVNSEDSGMEGLELMEDEAPDVALVIDNEVIGREPAVRRLHEYHEQVGEEQTHSIYHDISDHGNFFLPIFIDGMVFSWNKTMLDEMGVDVDDRTEDNLPSELASWKDIFEFADEFGEDPDDRPEFEDREILEFFPLSVAEVWSGYMQLSSGGWQIYEDEVYNEPGFDDPAFLEGLEFLDEFSNTNMSVDETGSIRGGDAMDWRWENYLDGDYPFGLVGTWMDVEEAMVDYGYEFQFSRVPTWEGEHPSTLYKTKGFVINSATEYPSAANEVLRWLYEQSTIETMIDNSTYIPALQEDADIYPDMADDYKDDMTEAMMADGWLESAETLPNNPSRRAMSVLYDIGVEDYMVEVWDGYLTPEEAQDAIVDAADHWIEENDTLD